MVEQVESGNADAALVFVTDVVTAGSKVTGVPIPDAQNVIGTYEIAVLKASTQHGGRRRPSSPPRCPVMCRPQLLADGFLKAS